MIFLESEVEKLLHLEVVVCLDAKANRSNGFIEIYIFTLRCRWRHLVVKCEKFKKKSLIRNN
jgi:hypothetical protein